MLKCADCDETNPQWGSLNRGVVLCDDCSSVHRHLGRHISQIKHLTKSRCRKTQMAMLKTLAQSGANKYWEHLLLESSLAKQQTNGENNRFSLKFRKPTPKNAVFPTKTDFIKEKYVFLGFFKKPRAVCVDDLNQQLHASVRTAVLETSLYLLTLGASVDYRHPSRHTAPLHVAALYNQPLQVELLLTYGADLLNVDGNGDTALQIAMRKSQASAEPLKWQVLISCLIEAQFEVTDSLSYYLCRQTIDHSTIITMATDSTGVNNTINNFLIPKLLTSTADSSNNNNNLDKARTRLQHLPNDSFIDLCLDICDEVDRRDTNDILLSSLPTTANSSQADSQLSLFFLPPNPNYSPTRNQGRQKLARLSTPEFRTLCHDVLVQASLRLCPPPSTSSSDAAPPQSLHHYHQLYNNNNNQSSSTPPRPLSSSSKDKRHRSSLPLGTSLDITTQHAAIISAGGDDHDPVYDQVAADGDYTYIMDLHLSHTQPQQQQQQQQQNILNNIQDNNNISNTIRRNHLNGAYKNNRISMPVEITGASSLIFQSNETAPPPLKITNNDVNDESNKAKSSLNDLLNKVDDLTGRNKLLQSKNNELEKRVRSLESQISQLKDEKSALMAALSSVNNKSSSKSYGAQSSNKIKIRSRNHSNDGGESADSCGDYQDNLEDVSKLLKMAQSPGLQTSAAPTAVNIINSREESNYDTGSDRFSSGPWLRQEILNSNNNIINSKGGIHRTSSESREGNLSQLQQSPVISSLLAHKKIIEQSNINKGNIDNLRMFSAQPAAIIRNYDNSDSICNIHRTVGADSREEQSHHTSPVSLQSNSNTPSSPNITNLMSDVPKGGGNMYHLPDYDTPPMEDFISVTSAIDNNTSNQVVNGVETIILQIRALLDIANGKKRGDFLHCSRAIQAAVQHLVRLFSSTERRYINNPVISTQISTALRDLLANSRDLRLRCEKNSCNNMSSSNSRGVNSDYDTAPVIQHAHEIARAAKMLLTHYQHEELSEN